jgi:hypothetical protein
MQPLARVPITRETPIENFLKFDPYTASDPLIAWDMLKRYQVLVHF